tara:strand:+ start:361 stop:519 length:159 start_codon:yes stop_codon:yes gene_type:complete
MFHKLTQKLGAEITTVAVTAITAITAIAAIIVAPSTTHHLRHSTQGAKDQAH